MVNTHVTVTSTRLDNSHDGSEESVTRNLDNAPNATQVPDEPASEPRPAPSPDTFCLFPFNIDCRVVEKVELSAPARRASSSKPTSRRAAGRAASV